MLFMEPKHLTIVQNILSKYPYSFYAFGSRARGNPKTLSDLDLCFFENIPLNVLAHIDEDFEESDLPYTVDMVHIQ
jgi:predicted nucleotidyltransferase